MAQPAPPSTPAPAPGTGPGPGEPEPRDERRLGWQGIAIAVAGFFTSIFGATILGAIAFALTGNETGDPRTFGELAAGSVGLWIGFAGVPIAASFALQRGGPVRDLALRWRPVDVPIGIAAAFGATVATSVAATLLLDPTTQEKVDELAEDVIQTGDGPLHAAALVVLLAILTPVVEELFFRGLLFRSLARIAPLAAAIPIASAVFGLLHYAGQVPAAGVLVQLGSLTAFGALLCWLVHRTGRLGPAIVAHGVFNLVTVIVVLQGGDG